jgi:hypothetical protein
MSENERKYSCITVRKHKTLCMQKLAVRCCRQHNAADVREVEGQTYSNLKMADALMIEAANTSEKLLHVCQRTLGWACGTHGRGEKRVQGFGGKARRKKSTRKTEA